MEKRGQIKFVDINPELVDEWDKVENDLPPEYYSYGSGYKAAWVCKECGRHYRAPIFSRVVLGSGCRVCHYQRGLEKRKAYYIERKNNPKPLTYNYKIAKFLKTIYNDNPVLLWRCPDCGHVWSDRLDKVIKRGRCSSCYMVGISSK